MTRRVYWGFAFLIILLLGFTALLLIWDTDTERDVVYEPFSPEEKEQVNRNIQEAIEKEKTPAAKPGYRIEKHGDHYHEVPINEPEPAIPNAPKSFDAIFVSDEAIYPHQELLDTFPVEALRAQAKDNNHWSMEYIPPFPADDVEANELARMYYVRNYYYTRKEYDHPIAVKAQLFITKWNVDSWDPYPRSARVNDLSRFNWTTADKSMFGDDYFKNLYPKRRTTFTQEDFDRANKM